MNKPSIIVDDYSEGSNFDGLIQDDQQFEEATSSQIEDVVNSLDHSRLADKTHINEVFDTSTVNVERHRSTRAQHNLVSSDYEIKKLKEAILQEDAASIEYIDTDEQQTINAAFN